MMSLEGKCSCQELGGGRGCDGRRGKGAEKAGLHPREQCGEGHHVLGRETALQRPVVSL